MVTNKAVNLFMETCERHHDNILKMNFLESEVCVDKKMSRRKLNVSLKMVFTASQVTEGVICIGMGRSWKEIQKSRHGALENVSPFKN